ncbi:hypothetical protein TNIN_394631 [Trichonephila inaurata madagascariensis]|uniref:Uncharacterized protein n=1 Tax=Trichonephila inaurata madagascariensis TaxID=2747483 RepID=A0A8X6YBT0_9ARAC|nr:hypothetical protein TNIN_394631 [Trichonephila inaurata madagascariensis]
MLPLTQQKQDESHRGPHPLPPAHINHLERQLLLPNTMASPPRHKPDVHHHPSSCQSEQLGNLEGRYRQPRLLVNHHDRQLNIKASRDDYVSRKNANEFQ